MKAPVLEQLVAVEQADVGLGVADVDSEQHRAGIIACEQVDARPAPTGAPADGEPLILLHAATGFGALQWYPNAARLGRDREAGPARTG